MENVFGNAGMERSGFNRDQLSVLTSCVEEEKKSDQSEPKPFDQLVQCQPFKADPEKRYLSRECIEDRFYAGLQSHVHQCMNFTDQKSFQKFVFQFAMNNGETIDTSCIKDDYKNNPAIVLSVQLALKLMLAFEANQSYRATSVFGYVHGYVNSAQLSEQYPHDNSFRKLLISLEEYSNKQDDIHCSSNADVHHLTTMLKTVAVFSTMSLSKYEIINHIREGNFYMSQSAVGQLGVVCGDDKEFVTLLHENDSFPAVQLRLAYAYHYEAYGLVKSREKAGSYYLQAILSNDSNCIGIDSGGYVEVLLRHQTFEQIQGLAKSGNFIAVFALSCIYARDVIKDFSPSETFVDVPINHNLAKELLQQLPSFGRIARDVSAFREMIESGK